MGFDDGQAEIVVDTHDFTGGFHLRSQEGVYIFKTVEGEDGLLYGPVADFHLFSYSQFLQCGPKHDLGCQFGQGDTCCLADEGDGAGGAGINLKDIELLVFHGKLYIHETDNPQFHGHGPAGLFDFFYERSGQGMRGKHTGRVSGMDAGLFYMFHDTADNGICAVTDGIHIHFDGVLEKFINENRVLKAFTAHGLHKVLNTRVVVDDSHVTAAKDVGWADDHGIADTVRGADGFFKGKDGIIFRLAQAKFLQKLLEPFPVFRPVYGIWLGADHFYSGLLQGYRQVQGGLSAELNNDPVRFFLFYDIQHIFTGKRLKIEFVRSIIVSGDGFRVGIDHNGFHSDFS